MGQQGLRKLESCQSLRNVTRANERANETNASWEEEKRDPSPPMSSFSLSAIFLP